MAIHVESCPQLCARQGVTLRHETGPVRIARRAAAVLFVCLSGWAGTSWRVVADRNFRTSFAPRYVAALYQRVLHACGVRVHITGLRTTYADAGEPVLVVGNHVGWLDVMALASVQPVRMVSKKEISAWPLIGTIGSAARTIFIDRFAPREVQRTRQQVAAALRAGNVVATFPEATTTCGRGIATMRPAMFQAAIDAGVTVQPVALSFHDRHGAVTTAGAYVGDQPLLQSIRSVLGQRDLTIRLEILPQISPKHVRPIEDRKALRNAAHESIAAALQPLIGDYAAHPRPTTCQAKRPDVTEVISPLSELEAIARRRPAAA